MAERTCSEAECDKRAKSRGLCNGHYAKGRRAGEVALLPRDGQHRLSNVDTASELADCSICGPGVRVKVGKGKRGNECMIKHAKSRYNPVQRRRHLYGLSQREYLQMLDEQAGRCLICDNAPEVLAVDHCHKTGKVRGLLCVTCNSAIGYLKDDPASALRAALYLAVR